MSEDLEKKIKSLEEKVRLLEIENSDWTGRAEDVFLFASTVESLSILTTEKEVFEVALEKISIMKNIPYCAFGTIGNGKVNIEFEYASFSEEEKSIQITLSPKMKTKLLEKSTIIESFISTNSEIKIEVKNSSFKPVSCLMHTYTNLLNEVGVFICLDSETADRLDTIKSTLLHSVTLVNSQLDNLLLLDKISEQNRNLEIRVAESIGELEKEIKEHIRTEEALKRSENEYRTMIERSNDMIWRLDSSGNIVFFNSKVELITELKINDYEGKSFIPVVLEEDIPMLMDVFARTIEGEALDYEFRLPTPKGLLTIATHTAPMYIEEQIIGVISFGKDITEQRKSEEALLESEQRFKALHNASFGGIAIHDKGLILECNLGLSEISGYSVNELMGMDGLLLIAEESREIVMKNILSSYEKPYEVIGQKKNGEKYHIRLEARMIPYKGKQVRVVEFRDITEHKQAEVALRESEERFSRLSDLTYEGIVIHKDGIVIDINSAIVKMSDYKREELIGKNIIQMIIKPKYHESLIENMEKNVALPFEVEGIRKDGTMLPLELESREIDYGNDNPNVRVTAVRDITIRKQSEKEILLAKMKAENADKMKSIFLAQMSHEIRTPINALVSMSSLIKYDFEENADEDQLQSFDIIDRAGARIIRTVDLLLNLSEIQAGTYEVNLSKFDVFTEVISQIVSENKLIAKKKNISLNLLYSTDDSELVADVYTVTQIFAQLIDNAIKYTVEGTVSVRIMRNKAEQLLVEIEDSGIGIEKEYIPFLFEPFSQEEMGYTRKFDGNGIGLTLVKTYCELNNATIKVESEKGLGSIFKVIFN